MLNFKMTTYNENRTYPEHRIFILNKGLNAGKPMITPCPNCFVCICNSDDEKEQMYWIFYSLWQGHKFREIQIGSVIPFIRKKEMTELVKSTMIQNRHRPEVFWKTITILRGVDSQITKYNDLSLKLKNYKVALVFDLFR
jgi:hypothetical protein